MDTALKQLVRQRNMTLKELAAELQYSRVHLTNVANGHPAGKKLAIKLVDWSRGRLRLDDLLRV